MQVTETGVLYEALPEALPQNYFGVQQAVSLTADSVPFDVPVLVLVWALGFVILAAFFTALYIRHRIAFMDSVPADGEFVENWLARHNRQKFGRKISVRVSCRQIAPLTYGIFRPVILLPAAFDLSDCAQLEYVLAHELVHIKRFDALTKLAAAAALALHWFNPFCWAMYLLLNRDMELSCDEAVIKSRLDNRAGYAMTLIGLAERGGMPVLHSNFGKYAIEERVDAIMKFKNLSFGKSLAAFVLVGITALLFGTAASDVAHAVPVNRPDVSRRGLAAEAPSAETAAITMEEAAQMGTNALAEFFGVDMDGLAIHMDYLAGTQAGRVEMSSRPMNIGVGGGEPHRIEMEFSEADGGWVPVITPDIPEEIINLMHQRGMFEPQPSQGYMDIPHRPSRWRGFVTAEDTEFDLFTRGNLPPRHFFVVNVETGALEAVGIDPVLVSGAEIPAIDDFREWADTSGRLTMAAWDNSPVVANEQEFRRLEAALTRRTAELAAEFGFGEPVLVQLFGYSYATGSDLQIAAAAEIYAESAAGEGVNFAFKGTPGEELELYVLRFGTMDARELVFDRMGFGW